MRLMYLTQWFDPEPNVIKGLRFVRALQAAGHQVTVVTGFPNYPTGKIYPGYRLRPIQRETIEGVEVVRLPLYPSHDASTVRRSLNYLSFFLSALLYSLFRRRRFDLAYVYHPPITVGLAAALAGLIRPLPFVLDVQDLWPEMVAASGMAGADRLARPLGVACRFVYRRARAIVAQSEGMRRRLIERGVAPGKVTTIHNWADGEPGAQPAQDSSPGKRFTVVYGGNLGPAQALDTALDAAAIVGGARDDIEIVLHGDGVDADALRAKAETLGGSTLRLAPRVSKAEILEIFARADALLLHLRDHPLFAITIPSKTQAYLAMGRPIVAGVAGEAAELLQRSGAALVVPPQDADALARAICALADLPRQRRDHMGRAGLRFYREGLSFDRGVDRTLALLGGVFQDARRRPVRAPDAAGRPR